MTAPGAPREAERLAFIEKMRVELDADLGEVRALCALAAEIARTPFAYLSVVGDTTQSLIAGHGIGTGGRIARSEAICSNLVATGGQLVISDTTADPRSAACPLVTGAPGVRSYAGTALEPVPELRVGALCVADTEMREFAPEVLARLRVLGDACAALLKAHCDKRELCDFAAREGERAAALRSAAERDTLTGLLNQGTFWRRVSEVMREGLPGALATIDVDNFKLVNDRHGHPFGDAYLRCIAGVLDGALPTDALAGRLGGDEFALFVPLAPETARQALADILLRLRDRLVDAARPLDVPELGRISIGAALHPEHGQNYEDLYKRADIALYAAKTGGRNCTRIYDRELDSMEHLRRLRSEFADALAKGHIEPFFQPLVHLGRNRLYGFETLVRWRHPERGLLLPGQFSRIFEERDTAPALTRHVIRTAVGFFTRIAHLDGAPRRIGLNVTEFDLLDADFADWVDWQLASAGGSWKQLVFEITENVALEDGNTQVSRTVDDLRRRGALIALDDFGTGHGTLKHLKDWPVDMVKIDRSFVVNVESDTKAASIVSAVVALGQSLGMGITCEGIETEGQRARVAEMGCALGQGYLFAPPMDRDATLGFLGCGEAAASARSRTS